MSKKKNQPKFMVGLEYWYCRGGTKYKCVYIHNGIPVLVHSKDDTIFVPEHPEKLSEVKEPRKLTFYVNIYQYIKNGDLFAGAAVYTDKAFAESENWSGAKRVDTVPVEWSEW